MFWYELVFNLVTVIFFSDAVSLLAHNAGWLFICQSVRVKGTLVIVYMYCLDNTLYDYSAVYTLHRMIKGLCRYSIHYDFFFI